MRESSFVSTFVVFVARLSVFFDLGGFGEGLGRVLGPFWQVFRGTVLEGFLHEFLCTFLSFFHEF